MHKSRNIFLINDDVRHALAIYEPDDEHRSDKHISLKTVDGNIAVDDLVIIPTKTNNRWDFTVVKVIAIDDEPDFDASSECRWIVGKAPIEEYKRLCADENDANNMIAQAQRKRKREELRKDLIGLDDEIMALPVANTSMPVDPKPDESPDVNPY